MENNTFILEFHILPFFVKAGNKLNILGIILFFFLYLFGILINIIIIIVICLDLHLHTPMYLFLCNLSVVDMCYTTVTVPKFLYILLSGDNIMSFQQCFLQIYFVFMASTSEIIVIFIMAYDRYVAICHPLHYYQKLNKNICIILMMVIWISACANSSLMLNCISKMIFCSTTTIHQFFCEAKALFDISCGGRNMFYLLVYANCLVFGLIPSASNVISYLKIIRVILRIKSKDGRHKAFSTCSSHLTVMLIYYGSGISVYMTPPLERYNVLELVLTVFYTTVTPVLNPLIYSLRNNELKRSIKKLLVWL
ncbi:olfactory receptor 2A12-like [Pyxicephalus adspersus]|uniref:Olfactory receptor n=1 Tax=Pyxicephalus adspersus TaxID=30357 RepID=A0AAV2ZM39_PYXAD|nr:TPA: hypothetical protein GDO54_015036 [Pyxicephalus adspersus]